MDLDSVKSDLVTREFLAVVVAGFGNELLPLTSDYGDEPCPKALLPIANKPMLEYVLIWLEQSGIKDVLLICPTIHRQAIYHHVHSDISAASLRIDLQTYDETPDTNTGTCTILRHFSSRISEDFVLVSCDFIPPPSLPLSILLNKFRADVVSDGCLATTLWYAAQKLNKGSLPDEWEPGETPVSIVWDDSTSTLLHVDTTDDLDNNADELELRMSLLAKYPRTRLSSNFRDAHVYVCRRTVLDALQEKMYFDSFRQEFLPWLCQVQYQHSKKEKYQPVLNSFSNTISQRLALNHSTLLQGVNYVRIREHGLPPSGEPVNIPAGFKIGIVIHTRNDGATRVNSIPNFMETNRRFLSSAAYSLPSDPKNRSLIDQKASISSDVIIGDSTQVAERTTIKKSVIGRHCIIGRMVKIIGCILFDHCVIEDGAKLENCIFGKNTRIGAKADISKCITQAGYEVRAEDVIKGEKLDVSDWTTASVEDLNDNFAGDDENIDEVTQ